MKGILISLVVISAFSSRGICEENGGGEVAKPVYFDAILTKIRFKYKTGSSGESIIRELLDLASFSESIGSSDIKPGVSRRHIDDVKHDVEVFVEQFQDGRIWKEDVYDPETKRYIFKVLSRISEVLKG
jgi:hypothetical protein